MVKLPLFSNQLLMQKFEKYFTKLSTINISDTKIMFSFSVQFAD